MLIPAEIGSWFSPSTRKPTPEEVFKLFSNEILCDFAFVFRFGLGNKPFDIKNDPKSSCGSVDVPML